MTAPARSRPPQARAGFRRAAPGAKEPAAELPVVRVLVDVSLAHLDRPYDYLVPEPDSGGSFRKYLEADVFPGNTIFIERGGIETAKNIGKRAYREILIELKG